MIQRTWRLLVIVWELGGVTNQPLFKNVSVNSLAEILDEVNRFTDPDGVKLTTHEISRDMIEPVNQIKSAPICVVLVVSDI